MLLSNINMDKLFNLLFVLSFTWVVLYICLLFFVAKVNEMTYSEAFYNTDADKSVVTVFTVVYMIWYLFNF